MLARHEGLVLPPLDCRVFFSTGFDGPLLPPSTTKDQADDRAAISDRFVVERPVALESRGALALFGNERQSSPGDVWAGKAGCNCQTATHAKAGMAFNNFEPKTTQSGSRHSL